MKSLTDMQKEVLELNKSKGWLDFPRPFEAELVHLHAEVSEAFEAYRKWGLDDMTEKPSMSNIMAWAPDAGHAGSGNFIVKPEGVGSEFADILIRLLDTCERYEVDLEFEYSRKMAFNQTRPYRHGGKRV